MNRKLLSFIGPVIAVVLMPIIAVAAIGYVIIVHIIPNIAIQSYEALYQYLYVFRLRMWAWQITRWVP
jgi:hypothetical protein